VWNVAMHREISLSAVRKSRDRTLSTLFLACRQSSTALRVLLDNEAGDEEEDLRQQPTLRSRLTMSSFNLQEWSQEGACESSGFAQLMYPI
jgi:hypothetical protein